MTSKAQRIRIKKARGLRTGRKLSTGERFPCGKLKPRPEAPIEPNRAVIEARALLAGTHAPAGIIAAENPLDLALFRGWIGKPEHAAGVALIELYRKAGVDLPDIRVQDLNRVAKGYSDSLGDASKMDKLRKIAEALHCWPKCRQAVFALVIMREWPKWMIERVMTGGNSGYNGVGRVHLLTGLRIIGKVVGVTEAEDRRAA